MGLRDRNLYHDKNIFFITTSCHKMISLLQIGEGFNIVSDSLNYCGKKYEASILAYVLMPNHIHLILHVAEGERRIDFMRDFKKFTSTMIRREVEKHRPSFLSQIKIDDSKQKYKVWQERYDELYLEDRKMAEVKIDYIHSNPLQERWNLVKRPEEYPHSSASYYELGTMSPITVTHYLEFM